ncbi:hypothetical protein EST38_g11951 [Candolleomyces aberdarensis]|uniref:Nephrocystin 3-like N-terminal domain-containing protein n=1 Tax=Candolleomyces aberdarensis TaxID=2316362 RepID=A0A4Q2D3P3_9AGAR|nr:hypothetical protein EST38_g11951 [Candolleomyces aberdarensis]
MQVGDAPPRLENRISKAHDVQIGQQIITFIAGNQYLSKERKDLILRLNPIYDASHTRHRTTSPPDSACFPGTRKGVIRGITSWADTRIVLSTAPVVHVYWFHGFAGSGKSAISLEIAKIYAGSGRLLASYFFFRNAGDRSGMDRFAVTLAAQMVASIPATASFIKAALKAEPGLLTQGVSLTMQLERLVYEPFRAALKRGLIVNALVKGPFLIVVDGLDECEDRQGVVDFIDHMLDFFKRHPSIPLRFFIASRVEQHIRTRLEKDGVLLGDLNSHSADEDIQMFLRASFQGAAVNDRVIQEYVRVHGEWPGKPDMDTLIWRVKGSFVLASTIFKFIIQPPTEEDPSTPLDRLPLALEMNGLDGLYARTLARSQHLPHFRTIISTIALLMEPLPIVGIADLLGIEAFKVVHVLLNLQAIVHVPGTDELGSVTLCHTSLRDFLTSEYRSGCFFVPPSFHLHLSYYSFSSIFKLSDGSAHDHSKPDFRAHWQAFVDKKGCKVINGIEQFKDQAGQSPDINRVPYHAFLCYMFFHSLSLERLQISVGYSYLFTQCVEQLALAAECPDRPDITRLWLDKRLTDYWIGLDLKIFQLTETTCELLQRNLQRASTAIHAQFPDIPGHRPRSTGMENEYVMEWFLSGRDVFEALQWMVARAQFEWEDSKSILRPPLKFSIDYEKPALRLILAPGVPAWVF